MVAGNTIIDSQDVKTCNPSQSCIKALESRPIFTFASCAESFDCNVQRKKNIKDLGLPLCTCGGVYEFVQRW